MKFLVVRDSSGQIQITVDAQEKPKLAEKVATITPESAVSVRGKVIKNPQVVLDGVELRAERLDVQSSASPDLPIPVRGKPANLGKRLDWRFLDLRRPENHLIFRVQTLLEQALREVWAEEGFIEIHSPKIMGAASESGAELFEIKNYFGKPAYLAQSPQFYKQYAIASGLDMVFEIGPVFRANPSFTSRHDTEFTSIDVEIAWINSHLDVMAFEERLIRFALKRVKEVYGEEIKKLYNREVIVPRLPFPRITMEEAHKILKREYKYSPSSGTKVGDLDSKGERLLGKYAEAKYGHEFIFVTDWPNHLRPFYHMRYSERPNITKSFDLLWKGLEITTGSQREHRYDVLLRQAKENNVDPQKIQFYLDIFKYGTPPHGGFGLGLTRMLMQMLGVSNVREVTFLYRGPNRLAP